MAVPFAGPAEAVGSTIGRVLPSVGPLARSTLSNAVVGSGYGALYGAGDSPEGQRASGAIAGGAAGAVAGGIAPSVSKIAGNVAGMVGQYLTSPAAMAAKRLTAAVAQSGATPMSSADIAAAKAAARYQVWNCGRWVSNKPCMA